MSSGAMKASPQGGTSVTCSEVRDFLNNRMSTSRDNRNRLHALFGPNTREMAYTHIFQTESS